MKFVYEPFVFYLRRWLVEDTEARSLLFRPIERYVEFASKFECQIDPDSPYWEHDLKLNDGSTLRLRGLNSILVSDHLDNNAEYHRILQDNSFWQDISATGR